MLFKANGFVIYKAAIHRKVSNSPEPPDRPAPPPGPVAPAQLQAGRSTLEAGDVFPPKAPLPKDAPAQPGSSAGAGAPGRKLKCGK